MAITTPIQEIQQLQQPQQLQPPQQLQQLQQPQQFSYNNYNLTAPQPPPQVPLQVPLQLHLRFNCNYNYNFNYTARPPTTCRSITGFALRSISHSNQPPIGFLSLKLPPPPGAVHTGVCSVHVCVCDVHSVCLYARAV